jgi:hypothetical protein
VEGSGCSLIFRVMSQHLPGGTEKNHEEPQSRWLISGPRFESGTSSRSVNHSTTTFGKNFCVQLLKFLINFDHNLYFWDTQYFAYVVVPKIQNKCIMSKGRIRFVFCANPPLQSVGRYVLLSSDSSFMPLWQYFVKTFSIINTMDKAVPCHYEQKRPRGRLC